MDSVQNQTTPPNGGWLAWRQVFCSFLMSMCSLGLANAFGIFQSAYQTTILSAYPPSTIAWIGTIQGFLVNVTGLLSGRLFDAGHVRPLLYAGTLLNAAGLVAASAATSYPTVLLSLGVCVGLGSGLFYVPALALLARYFTSTLPLAAGLAATGASVGGAVYPVLFRAVLNRAGLAWACRAMGLLNGGVLLVSCALVAAPPAQASGSLAATTTTMRTRTRTKRLFDAAAFSDGVFVLFSIALFLLWLGVDVPFFFLPGYVADRLGLPPDVGDYLLSGMNAASLLGRTLLGLAAVHVGPMAVWQFSIGASCVLLACWVAIRDLAGIIVFVVLYGLLTGGVISLVSSALLVISPDLDIVGTRLGMASVLAGLGFLVGPPIAGALVSTAAGYVGQSVFAASAYFAALVVLALVSGVHRRRLSRRQAYRDISPLSEIGQGTEVMLVRPDMVLDTTSRHDSRKSV